MRFILLGPPGAGKGTQGKMLAQAYSVPHIATGAMIRTEIEQRTEFGRTVSAAISQGNFAPDAAVIRFVCARLSEPDTQRGYILDGFPRDLAQAEAFDGLRNQPLDAVIELQVEEADLIERLAGRLVCSQCGENYHVAHKPPRQAGICDLDGKALIRRADDEPGAIHHRMEVYQTATRPVLDYYSRRGLLITVDASGDALLAQKSMLAALKTLELRTSGV